MTDINALSRELYGNARDKGFYDHEDWLRRQASNTGTAVEYSDNNGTFKNLRDHMADALAEHFGNRFMLIAGEANEAHDEVRAGHGIAELYFSINGKGEYATATHPEEQYLLKPEGVLAELADVAIRTLETMQSILDQASDTELSKLRAQIPQSEATELGRVVNVAEVILLKHRYNLSRAAKHGGKAF